MTQHIQKTETNFNADVNASGSNIGCIIYQEKPLDQLFIEAVSVIRNDIQTHFTVDLSKRQSLLGILNNVEIHFQEKSTVLGELITQASCKKSLTSEIKSNFMLYLISFLVSATYHHESTSLPEFPDLATNTGGKKRWAFSAALSTPLSYEHHLGAIADYIASDPKDTIKDGDCYIFKLLMTNCDDCHEGKLINSYGAEKGLSGILFNFFRMKRMQGQSHNSDFFTLETEHRVNFKCGECICNLTILDKSKGVL